METLTSAPGALGLAIAALLLVVGFRFARPERGVEWAAAAAYAASIGVTFAAGSGLLGGPRGPEDATDATQRLAGGAVLVAGLLLAGAASRARRRIRAGVPAVPGRPGRAARGRLHAGLALVLVGFLLRAPSPAGAIAAAAALAVHAWAAFRGESAPPAGLG